MTEDKQLGILLLRNNALPALSSTIRMSTCLKGARSVSVDI